MPGQPLDPARRRGDRHQRALLTCKHFNGVLGPLTDGARTCGAGVAYRAHVGGEDSGWVLALPCLPHVVGETRRRAVVPCALREFPTEAEIEAEEEIAERRFALTIRAIALCREHAGSRGASGTVPCPACGGELTYSVSAYNGHLHGKCATTDCLAWME